MAKRQDVKVPYSKLKEALVKLLSRYRFVGEVSAVADGEFTVKLLYPDGKPAITEVKRVSKPGLRRYARVLELEKNKQQLGFFILSTPKGLMTHVEAKKKRLGGEVLCKIW